MESNIIDGKKISGDIKDEVTEEVRKLKEQGIIPGLAVVLVGENPASQIYVKSKEKSCEAIGIYSEKHLLPENVSQDALLDLVGELNNKENIDGILVQLPLPKHIDEDLIIEAILPEKDVDGFHPISVGKLLIGQDGFVPCTPHGIMVLLERTGVDLKGKEVVIIGRSNIVGKPIFLLLLRKHATVTICHTRTKDIEFHTKRADVLIVAAGRPKVVTAEMVKEGVVVIDVGINRVDGKLCGDVDFDEIVKKAAAITPVPGGVGPMTVAMLMKNTLESAKKRL